WPEPGDARVVDARLQVGVRVDLRRSALQRLARGERLRVRRAVVSGDEASGALDAVVEAHGLALPSREEALPAPRAALLARRRRGDQALRELADRLREVRSRVGERDRLAAVDAERNGAVGGQVGPDLRLEGALHLGALDADVRVRAVQQDADALAREREQLERLEAQAYVLDRRYVEPAEQEQVVGAIERREHRAVEERRRVDDDRVVRSPRDLEQACELALGDELGVLGLERSGQDVDA